MSVVSCRPVIVGRLSYYERAVLGQIGKMRTMGKNEKMGRLPTVA